MRLVSFTFSLAFKKENEPEGGGDGDKIKKTQK